MATNFPLSPTIGQIYPTPAVAGMPQYVWDGVAWKTVTGGNQYVLKTGDTMTGALGLPGDPTTALQAATKQYVDAVQTSANTKVAKTGDTMSGALLIQQGSSPSSWGNQPAINIGYISAGSRPGIVLRPSADPGNAMNFVNNADGAVGSITTSATATAYNTSSDIRLKEGLETFDAGRIVDATEVFSFKWKSAPTGERSYGVSAQQAQEVFPQAVTYDSAADWYGIDYSKYVPVLLQELKSLRVRVAELEGHISKP